MKLEYYSSDKLKEEIRRIVSEYLDMKDYELFFFGSRVTGDSTERSDIDVGIEGPEPVSSAVMFKIQEEVDKIPTLYKIEVVDFKKVSEEFKKVSKAKTESLI